MRLLTTFIVALCLIASQAYAAWWVQMGGPVAGGGADSCGLEIDYDFAWTGEYSGDTDKACVNSDGDTAIDGTLSGATISTAQANSGTYSVLVDTNNDRISWPITSSNTFNSDEGFVDMHFYPDTSGNGNSLIFDTSVDSSDNLQITLQSNMQILAIQESTSGGMVHVYSGSGQVAVVDQWNHVQIRWRDGASEILSVRVCSDNACSDESWIDTGSSNTVAAFASEPSNVVGGEANGNIYDTIYLDDILIWKTYAQ